MLLGVFLVIDITDDLVCATDDISLTLSTHRHLQTG